MPPSRSPLPIGFRLEADRQTRTSDGGRVVDGGSPWRMLRLSSRGSEVAVRLLDGGPVAGEADGALARRLVEAGLAHPLPPALDAPLSLSVVVPIRDRADELHRCLEALNGLDVVVVDDGSDDESAVAEVAARHHARVIRRE